LIEQYQTDTYNDNDTAVTALLETCEIHIVPVLNPWGVVNDRKIINGVPINGRKTADGVDINRDFGSPDPSSDEPLYNTEWFRPWYGGFTAKESRILRDLCERELYMLSIQGHTGAENINLPMDYLGYETEGEAGNTDYLDTYIPIYPLMEEYAKDYVTTLRALPGLSKFYYIEGYDCYEVVGSVTDWHFGALGAPGYTIEYDTYQGQTGEGYSEAVWMEHKNALINLLGITTHRISGRVTAASDNSSVSALITFQRSADRSRAPGAPTPITLTVRSDPDTGYYHILIPDGDWDMMITTSEYNQYTATVIKSGNDPIIQNIKLSSPAKY